MFPMPTVPASEVVVAWKGVMRSRLRSPARVNIVRKVLRRMYPNRVTWKKRLRMLKYTETKAMKIIVHGPHISSLSREIKCRNASCIAGSPCQTPVACSLSVRASIGCRRGADTFNRNRRSGRRPDFIKRGFILQRIIQLAYTSPSALITLPLAIQCRQHRRRQNNRGASA